ncbi:succinylglutamate desuccinylase/aspartoacylase family protein [Croceitalea marina]|uniref:Succinylglutamate desuccinylase/aspartoacylase family protein n=1 Tax=Croceitalea marina TaxID=1775166 RepID=A0ABW5MWW7_9FLAO
MYQKLFLILTTSLFSYSFCQENVSARNNGILVVEDLHLEQLESGKIHKLWLQLGENELSEPIKVPVLIAKGDGTPKVLGLTAAIHGNELNGIAIIHQFFSKIDVTKLKGTIIAIPGLNSLAVARNQREFLDRVDLNRILPGKPNGNGSEQMTYKIGEKIIPLFDYHVDLHTASFGRINSLYGRGDMKDETLASMLQVLEPDIIVSNRGKASFGSASGLTMRAFAISKGVKSVTMEYGNPQVYQKDMIERGVKGLKNLIIHLGLREGEIVTSTIDNICSKSYWIYTDKGGYLDVKVSLNQKLKKDELIAILRNSFGELIATYRAPEDGIVIGKSTNPVNISGGRIIHLGILEK